MAVTTRALMQQNIAAGKSIAIPMITLTPGNVTAAAAASGGFTCGINFNGIGTSPTSIKFAPTTSPIRMLGVNIGNSQGRGLFLVHLYKIGTLALNATGDQFTHDAATFPILRTQFGETSKPLSLTPLIQITTATTTTIAVFTIKTNAGGTGYTDQDGNATVGTKTFTMPNAATAVRSTFFLRLESNDSGVRDIAQIAVSTAAAAGAATIWGAEFLAAIPSHIASTGAYMDSLYGTFQPMNLTPGLATSGTATSHLAVLCVGQTGGAASYGYINGVIDV